MKKIFSILSAGLVALAAISCVQEKMTVFDPTQATAPVLASYEVTGDGITATYNPGSFGQSFNTKMPVNHSLVLVSVNGAAANKMVSATFKDGSVSASAANISKALMALGCAEETYASFDMIIRASMQEVSKDNGLNGHVDSDGKISVSDFYVKIPEVKGNPWKDYTQDSPYGVVGSIASTGNAWGSDEPMYMPESGNSHVCKNLKLSTNDEFKIRTKGTWDEVDLGGPGDAAYVVTVGEAFEATAKGKNIKVPADGNYDILYDEAAGTITISEAYQAYPGFDTESDEWGITGAVASFGLNWDKDIALMTDGTWLLAEGVELTTDDAFKFRTPGSWSGNDAGGPGDAPYVATIGEDQTAVEKGKDIKVPANGVYDILFNPVDMIFRIVETLGGSSHIKGGEEPEPEPEERADWYYHGQSASDEWGELPFTKVSDTEYVLELTTKVENAAFVLKNGDASKWIGADASQKGEDGKYLVEIGKEFKISEDKVDAVIATPGDYVFTFNPEAMTATIEKAVRADWYYHGQSASADWGELPFKKVSDTEYVLNLTTKIENANFVLKNGDASKWIGADASQKGEDGKYLVEIGKEFKISEDKVDAVIAAPGEYVFTFNPETMTAVIKSNRADWYYHGQSASSDWGELAFKKVSDEEYVLNLTTKVENAGFVLKNGDATKWIGADASQKGEDGKFLVEIGKEFKISEDKVDGVIAAPGEYIFTFNPVAMTAVVTSARADWYYHGQSASSDWGELPFKKVSDDVYVLDLDVKIDGAAFVLKNGDASQWIGADASMKGEDNKAHIVPGQEFTISSDKVDAVIEKAGKYTMTFYVKDMKAVIATAEPEYCYHGQSKRTPNWGTVPFEKVSDDEFYVILEVEAGYAFVLKTADEKTWFGAAASQKGEDGKFHVVADTEFDVSTDKVDGVFDTAGTYKLTYKPSTQKAVANKL